PEVLPPVPGNTGGWGCEVHAHPSQKSEFECLRGALGSFHQAGMPIEADPVRGDLATACCVRVSATLSSREKPPRQGQSLALPSFCSAHVRSARRNPLSGAARRLTQVLQPDRMSILAKVRPAKSWHVQWETVPPGEKSETP